MRYISLKNEQNRCNALRGALLLPVGFFRAVFALDGRIGRQGVPNSHQTLTTELSSSTARPSSHNICLPVEYHRPIYYAMTEALVLTVSSGGSD